MQFIAALYEQLPDDLCVAPAAPDRRIGLLRLEAEVDELWSFVGRRADKQWLWLAFDKESRQVLAFYVGDRSRESARELWRRLPAPYRERATFYSDDWEAYRGVIPSERHQVCGKESGLTSGVERFNCTLRQWVSRLVRKKSLVLEEAGEPHRGDQVFHLPLQPGGDAPSLTSITFSALPLGLTENLLNCRKEA